MKLRHRTAAIVAVMGLVTLAIWHPSFASTTSVAPTSELARPVTTNVSSR